MLNQELMQQITGVTLLTDSSVTASNGTLTSFGLTGAASNWARFACYGNQLSLYIAQLSPLPMLIKPTEMLILI
jgi:hypothetical protein